MKIPEPILLPSGSWQAKVMVNKKRQTKTFATKEEAILWSASVKAGRTMCASTNNITVGQAIDYYIESKSKVLSVSTITSYKRIRKQCFAGLMSIKLKDIDQHAIQVAVNEMSADHAPKTVRNAYGLLTAAISVYAPDMKLHTTLPQREKYDIKIPTKQEIQAIQKHIKGTDFELPFLLAAWMGLRASEICGLTWDCIEGKTLHIKQALVTPEYGKPVLKTTKTFSSNRKLEMPDYIEQLISEQPRTDDFIIHIERHGLLKRLKTACKHLGFDHYRFHDLRHYYASIMLEAGIPDKYAMEQMGHSSTHMLKNVYQHTIDQAKQSMIRNLNAQFKPD